MFMVMTKKSNMLLLQIDFWLFLIEKIWIAGFTVSETEPAHKSTNPVESLAYLFQDMI